MLNKHDNQLCFYALNMWANWIETGDINMSARDAVNCGEEKQIQALDTDQMKLIIRLRELADKMLNKE